MKHALFIAVIVLLAVIAVEQWQANDIARQSQTLDTCLVPPAPGEQYSTWVCHQ